MRPKWDQQHGEDTYGATTIAKALIKVVKQYAPKTKRPDILMQNVLRAEDMR